MATKDKSTFDRFQSLMTILTPILVVAIGAYLNQNITRVESEIKNVEAMKEFFELIAGEDVGKAKMAAYALYMLNKEDRGFRESRGCWESRNLCRGPGLELPG